MKTYILTIISATLLSAFSANLAPEKWQKYVKIITGLVLIICIVSPLKSLVSIDWPEDFEFTEYTAESDGKTQTDIVVSELSERICRDVEERLIKEFNIAACADVKIDVDSEGKINGVKEIHITGAVLTGAAKARLCEVYGVSEVYNE
ncbi:MAG: stage III sporulation protein AF [Clostridia bacterium]|nr:stage III sporulation protein AF [Clostridia bacterium]